VKSLSRRKISQESSQPKGGTAGRKVKDRPPHARYRPLNLLCSKVKGVSRGMKTAGRRRQRCPVSDMRPHQTAAPCWQHEGLGALRGRAEPAAEPCEVRSRDHRSESASKPQNHPGESKGDRLARSSSGTRPWPQHSPVS